MRHKFLMPLVLSLLLADVATQDFGRRRGNRVNRTPVELEHGEFQRKSFHSRSLDQEMNYGLYLPDDYDEDGDEKYPLVIWLHGMRNDYTRFHTAGGTAVVDRLIGEGKLPSLILVTADAGNSFYINGKTSGKYEDLITVDLIEEMAAKYRVAGTRGMRAIMGISMGGLGALKIALRKPELFGSVAAHSSAILPADPNDLPGQYQQMLWGRYGDQIFGNPLDVQKWRSENPMYLVDHSDTDSLKGLRIYFDVGTRDRYQFASTNRLLHDAMKEHKIPHTWFLIEGGGHAWSSGFPMEALVRSLLFVGEGFKAAKDSDDDRDR